MQLTTNVCFKLKVKSFAATEVQSRPGSCAVGCGTIIGSCAVGWVLMGCCVDWQLCFGCVVTGNMLCAVCQWAAMGETEAGFQSDCESDS